MIWTIFSTAYVEEIVQVRSAVPPPRPC